MRAPGFIAVLTGGLALCGAAWAAPHGPEEGAGVFEVNCSNCHSAEAPPRNKMGPSLLGVVGRPPGTAAGYNYSAGFSSIGQAWTPELLDQYLQNPKALAPHGRMSFKGLASAEDRAKVIAFLASKAAPAP